MKANGAGLRRLAYLGARYGPTPFVEYSPTFIGAVFAALLPEMRERVRGNLRRVHGERGRLSEAKDVLRTFVAYAHCLTESLAADRPEALAAAPHVVGGEHLRSVLAEGRGAVLVTAHTGAWDAAARFLARDRAVDVGIVMAKEPDEGARALSDAVRDRSGVRVFHVGDHPLDALPALRHLRQGGILAVQLDRPGPSGQALTVQLAGQPFEVPSGPFRLASLGGVPVIPVFTRRVGYFRHEVTVSPPIVVPARASDADILAAATAAAGAMESFISRNPTQWFHFSG